MTRSWSTRRALWLTALIAMLAAVPAVAAGGDADENGLHARRPWQNRRDLGGPEMVVVNGTLGADHLGRLTLDDEVVLAEDPHTRWLDESRPGEHASPSQGRTVRILGHYQGRTLVVRIGVLRDAVRASREVLAGSELLPEDVQPADIPQ